MKIEPIILSEPLKLVTYVGLVFWVGYLCDYLAGIFLKRSAKYGFTRRADEMKLKSVIRKITIVTKIFEVIISIYAMWIIAILLISQVIYLNSVVFLLSVYIPCYFNLIGFIRVMEIALEKWRAGKAESGI